MFHTQVEEVINLFDFLSPNYRLVVDKKGNMDRVCVEVEMAKGLDTKRAELGLRLKNKIKDTIGLSMDIELKAPLSIPRSQGGKLSRIWDKRS